MSARGCSPAGGRNTKFPSISSKSPIIPLLVLVPVGFECSDSTFAVGDFKIVLDEEEEEEDREVLVILIDGKAAGDFLFNIQRIVNCCCCWNLVGA